MDKVEIKIKKYSDVVLCDVPDTQDGMMVLVRLAIHAPKGVIIPTGQFQFAMSRDHYPYLQTYIKHYLNPEVVKIVDEDIEVLAKHKLEQAAEELGI